MFWTLGLTDSYLQSINLAEVNSVRNLHDILENVLSSPNLILADDKNLKCIEKLRNIFKNQSLLPEYEIETSILFQELLSKIKIEKNFESKKKCIQLKIENNDDYDFIDKLNEKNLVDAVIVNEEDDYFMDLDHKNFEVIKNKKSSGIKFSKLLKNYNLHRYQIPKRNKNNISEIKKIFLDSSEVNLVLFNFLNEIHKIHNNHEDEFSAGNQMISTITFLGNLISQNEMTYEKEKKTVFNILTPMPDDHRFRQLNMDDFIEYVEGIFKSNDSILQKLRAKFEETGNILNLFIVERSHKSKLHKTLHSRGIFTEYCNISTEQDAFCYFNGQVTGVNKNLVLQYSPNWRVQEINSVVENTDISKKIKIF